VCFPGAALFQKIQFWPIAGTISLITIIGATLAYTYNRSPTSAAHTPIRNNATGLSPAGRATLALLLAWIIIHLSLAAIEILYRPVFPWDAWLNWMYRAKAWFFEGAIFGFSSPIEWATDTGALAYNVGGHNYPTFVPTIAFWAACSLGFWSDTLVNTPVLFCGIALAMGIYGQCREFGGSYLHSVAAAYLLLSVPLVGTHLALAGYADIWIAGFTGLGFAALTRGLIDDNRFQSALGLLMAALAITVKAEGLVWRSEQGFVREVFDYTSGMISTARSFKQKYGVFNAKIKLAGGSVAQAFWMVSETMLPHIDVVRFENGKIYSNYFWGNSSSPHKALSKTGGAKYADEYFIYTLEWTPNKLIWKINGKVFKTQTSGVPQEEMYINFSSNLKKDADENGLPSAMEIDWVRVYKLKGK